MAIGLSKNKIEQKIKAVLVEELTPTIGVLSQERIASVIAGIITENNRKIEQEIENQIRRLESKLRN